MEKIREKIAKDYCPFQRVRDYPGCFEDCPDVDICPVNILDILKPEIEQAKREVVREIFGEIDCWLLPADLGRRCKSLKERWL